jgi:1-acyl-sn-glycerol-3-phosphate acyltransferase
MSDSVASRTRHPLSYLYGIYAWIAFIACALLSMIVILIIPGLERRRRCATAAARTAFALCGISITVRGLEKLPADDFIVVANHASYVDAVIWQAVLPPTVSYVAKRETEKYPLVGFYLKRIGIKFVDRFSASGSARDARNLIRAASAGESLAFFPEGTFIWEAGLSRFRAGAFVAAISGSVAVVPMVISGSRHILRARTILPRHGHLHVEFLNPIEPSHPAFADGKDLAQLSRRRILEVLNEPDLMSDAKR